MTVRPKLFTASNNSEGQLSAGIIAAASSLVLRAGEGDNFPRAYNGDAEAGGSSVLLKFTGAGSLGLEEGSPILNLTDGSNAFVVSVNGDDIVTTTLQNGTTNLWNDTNEFTVNPFLININKRSIDAKTGQAEDGGSATQLVYAAATGLDLEAGDIVLNITDSSSAVVVNVSAGVVTTTNLTGGVSNVWNEDDIFLARGINTTTGLQTITSREIAMVKRRVNDTFLIETRGFPSSGSGSVALDFDTGDYVNVYNSAEYHEGIVDFLYRLDVRLGVLDILNPKEQGVVLGIGAVPCSAVRFVSGKWELVTDPMTTEGVVESSDGDGSAEAVGTVVKIPFIVACAHAVEGEDYYAQANGSVSTASAAPAVKIGESFKDGFINLSEIEGAAEVETEDIIALPAGVFAGMSGTINKNELISGNVYYDIENKVRKDLALPAGEFALGRNFIAEQGNNKYAFVFVWNTTPSINYKLIRYDLSQPSPITGVETTITGKAFGTGSFYSVKGNYHSAQR